MQSDRSKFHAELIAYLEQGKTDSIEDITGGFDFDGFGVDRATMDEEEEDDLETENGEDSEDDEDEDEEDGEDNEGGEDDDNNE